LANPRSTLLVSSRQRLAALQALRPLGAHLLVVVPLLLASALFLAGVPLQTHSSFSAGGVGPPLTQGFNPAETAEGGRGFRWTKGDAVVNLAPLASASHIVQLGLSAPRPSGQDDLVPTAFSINDQLLLQTTLSGEPRRYALLIPREQIAFAQNRLRIQSPTFAPIEANSGQRQLGVVVFEVGWSTLGASPWLLPAQLGLIGLAAVLFYLLLVLNGIHFWPRMLALGLFCAIMLAMRHSDVRFLYRWHALIMSAALSLALAVALALSARWRPAASQLLGLRAWLGRHWLAFVGHCAVTGLMLYPLLLNFSSASIGPPGDSWEYIWKMQWFSDALIGQQRSPVLAPQIFFPSGAELTFSEIAPAHNLINLPITYLFGVTISYNLSVVGSFVLTAFFTYLLAQRLGARRGAAWVAGLIFAFCVRRYYHVLGHFGMTGSQWLPLLLYGWEGLLSRRRAWDGYVAGMGYALSTWCTLIYGTTVPFFVLLYTLVRIGPRSLLSLRLCWQPLLLMGAISVALVAPLAQPYLELQLQGGAIQHPYAELVANAIPPLAYFYPNPFHPLWGQWASQLYPSEPGEHYGSIGYTALALSIAGLWVGRGQRAIWALAAGAIAFAVLSFGPEIRLSATTSLILPAKWLYEHAPVFGSIRTWGRMIIYVMICVAVLAALGLSALPRAGYRLGWLLAAVLVLAESASLLPLSSLRPRPVDLWLREQPGSGGVVHMPHDYGEPREYYTLLFSGKPTNQGSGKFLPSAYREGVTTLDSFPAASALRLMQRWATDYIVVDEAGMDLLAPGWRGELDAEPLLTKLYEEGGYRVYRLRR
jgi:hypothetical protein